MKLLSYLNIFSLLIFLFSCGPIKEERSAEGNRVSSSASMSDVPLPISGASNAEACFLFKDELRCKGFENGRCHWDFLKVSKKHFCLPSYVPQDPQFQYQWHLLNKSYKHEFGVNAVDAWGITRGDPKVILGIIDTGFPADLKAREPLCTNRNTVINNISQAHGDYDYRGDHGLSVAFTAAAWSDMPDAVSGVAQLTSLRIASLVSTPKGQMNINDVNSGIKWLANIDPYKSDAQAHIINLSMGRFVDISQPFGYYGVVRKALSREIIVVAAAGNEAENVVKCSGIFPIVAEPASIAGVISVGATSSRGEVGNFSNWGPFVDILAPGVNIRVNAQNSSIKPKSGTSFAAPIVSGIISLMKSVYPGLTPAIAKHILRQTAIRFECDKVCSSGYGIRQAQCQADMCPAANNSKLWRFLGLANAPKAVMMAQKGMPQDPIIQSELNWIGIGTTGLSMNDGRFFVRNLGPVEGEVSLAPNQDTNLVLTPTSIAPNNARAELKLSYNAVLQKQKSAIVYFDVHEKSSARYIDTFAIVFAIK